MNTLIQIEKKRVGLSQQTLAEGICEQARLVKWERAFHFPIDPFNSTLAWLEVPLDHFLMTSEIKSNPL